MKPVPPPPLYIMKGLPIPFLTGPSWLWEEHYRTSSGIAISQDGSKTHPKRLPAEKLAEVAEFKARYANYRLFG